MAMIEAHVFERQQEGVAGEFAYWLGQCDGYRVDSADGRIGVVEAVRQRPGSCEPQELAVRAGLFGRRVLLVAADQVARIVPREQRIVLEGRVEINGSYRLPRPRPQLHHA